MAVRAMLVILLRIAAIVFLFKAVQAAPELLALLGKDDGYEGYAAARNLGLVYFMVNLIVAFVLWIYHCSKTPESCLVFDCGDIFFVFSSARHCLLRHAAASVHSRWHECLTCGTKGWVICLSSPSSFRAYFESLQQIASAKR